GSRLSRTLALLLRSGKSEHSDPPTAMHMHCFLAFLRAGISEDDEEERCIPHGAEATGEEHAPSHSDDLLSEVGSTDREWQGEDNV
ncbi:unnamed protein product, partial [Ectocarpus sp. 12 AP-2014]